MGKETIMGFPPIILFSISNLLLLTFLGSVSLALVANIIGPYQPLSDGKTLVSGDGSFQLGFFSPGNSKNRYLGIWYNNIPTRTVVWVANRCNPINDSSGMLTVSSSTGNLVLVGHNTKKVFWSTSSQKKAKNPLAQLLDNGNLVLRDGDDGNEEAYLWQSFDYPCDTLLPEMKLGWDFRTGLNRDLSAWKNPDDPCPGHFTSGIELGLHTYPEAYVRDHGAKFYRTGPWNGLRYSGEPDLRLNPLFSFRFVYNDDEVYYTYNLINKSLISRIVLNETTSMRQRLVWIEAERTWKQYNSVPRDYCDQYGICGANGICVIAQSPVCECLEGFRPKSEENWTNMVWSQGCERSVPLRCQEKHKDEFVKFVGLKLPDTTNTRENKSINQEECRTKCLSNCSCMAYTSSDIRGKGSGCVLWFGDLVDIRGFPENGQDLYIRMPASELGMFSKISVLIVQCYCKCIHDGFELNVTCNTSNKSSLKIKKNSLSRQTILSFFFFFYSYQLFSNFVCFRFKLLERKRKATDAEVAREVMIVGVLALVFMMLSVAFYIGRSRALDLKGN